MQTRRCLYVCEGKIFLKKEKIYGYMHKTRVWKRPAKWEKLNDFNGL